MTDDNAVARSDQWASRIVGTGEEYAEQLLANPDNWRVHPHYQQDALKEILAVVGWVQPIIVNARTSHVIDGHLRVHLALVRGEKVPVTYVDLSIEEERLVLATLDPLSGLAIPDKLQLTSLMDDIYGSTKPDEDEALRGVLDVISKQNGVDQPANGKPRKSLDPQLELCVCNCGHQHYKIKENNDGELSEAD